MLYARQIAQNKNELPAKPVTALRKLFYQEKRDWSQPSGPQIGWKRGELFEVADAILTHGNIASEWGDVGYYIAQTWQWLWELYDFVTPQAIIDNAVAKFQNRAAKGAQHDR